MVFSRLLLVGLTGLEPVTSCMSSKHSNQLSYSPRTLVHYTHISKRSQGEGGIFLAMTERQQRFVDLYNASGNVAEAMEKAGYSPASIKKYGTRLLAQPEVAAAITCAREARLADMTEICTFPAI